MSTVRKAKPGAKDFDTSQCCVTDAELRGAGFTIAARPKDGEPVWRRGGKDYKQSEAVKLLPTLAQEAAEKGKAGDQP